MNTVFSALSQELSQPIATHGPAILKAVGKVALLTLAEELLTRLVDESGGHTVTSAGASGKPFNAA